MGAQGRQFGVGAVAEHDDLDQVLVAHAARPAVADVAAVGQGQGQVARQLVLLVRADSHRRPGGLGGQGGAECQRQAGRGQEGGTVPEGA